MAPCKLLCALIVIMCAVDATYTVRAASAAATTVLSNTQLPVDTRGKELLTGEGDALWHPTDGHWYVYFNDWGGCPDVDCCASSGGCASCCFNPPSKQYPDACVYTNNHTVVVYRTRDLATWEYLGAALSVGDRHEGIEFRPHVVYNAATDRFVMWYIDRWSGQDGYAVAVSNSAQGPFTTLSNTVHMATPCKIGDFDILVDDDGTAYHVRTGFAVEQLNADYTGVTGAYYRFTTPKPSEGPVFFKRRGVYYVLPGTGCCACLGGSSMYVFTASQPLGPYQLQGEVASNRTGGHVFDIHSPYNYVTHAQASAVFQLPAAPGGAEARYLWMGNQWATSRSPDRARNHDLLYWTLLPFADDGNITQLEYADEVQLPWASTSVVA